MFLNTTLYRTYARETVNMYNTRALVVRTRQYYVLYVLDFISYYILLCIGLPWTKPTDIPRRGDALAPTLL